MVRRRLGRVGVAAVHSRERRPALVALALAVATWGTGAVVTALAQLAHGSAALVFPTPLESFFAASFLGFAGFLLLDVAPHPPVGTTRPGRAAWWAARGADVVVLVGGAASATVGLLSLPLHTGYLDAVGVLALAYPAVWLALAALVGVQVLTGRRPGGGGTSLLAVGCLLLAAADVVLSTALPLPELLGALHRWAYGAGLTALTAGACAVRRPAVASCRRSATPLVPAAAAAVTVLVARPLLPGGAGAVLTATAAVTLAAVLLRFELALAEARGASESRRLSLTDDLTGLMNRRGLLEAVRTHGTSKSLDLLLVDLDGFKQVNDVHGHAAGDAVLVEVAARLRTVAARGDAVARLGGDEFALVRAGDHPAQEPVAAYARRVEGAVGEPLRLPDGTVVRVGASVGAATAAPGVLPEADLASVLLGRADLAMYAVKSRRRAPPQVAPGHPGAGGVAAAPVGTRV